ncbi:hypothetical protein QTP88_029997 [Uroleucon formosanum]
MPKYINITSKVITRLFSNPSSKIKPLPSEAFNKSMSELHTFQQSTSTEIKTLYCSLDFKFAEIKESMLSLTTQINVLKEENASLRSDLFDLSKRVENLESTTSMTLIQMVCLLCFRNYETVRIWLVMLLFMVYLNHLLLNQQLEFLTMPNPCLKLSNPSCRLYILISSPLDLVNQRTVAPVYLRFFLI